MPSELNLALHAAHVQGMVHKGNPHQAPVAPALIRCAPVSSGMRIASQILGTDHVCAARLESHAAGSANSAHLLSRQREPVRAWRA